MKWLPPGAHLLPPRPRSRCSESPYVAAEVRPFPCRPNAPQGLEPPPERHTLARMASPPIESRSAPPGAAQGSVSSMPGPSSRALLEELGRYVKADPFPFAVDLARCEGMYVMTVDGERLFDWAGYYASKWIAHNHPRLYEPEYVRRLVVAANNKIANVDFLTPECLEYYRELYGLAPACMRNPNLELYVVNSGAEAVENMMKYFISLHAERHGPRGLPLRFLYFGQAFHGRTVFALNVTELTHAPVVTKGFHGLVSGNIQIPFPSVNTELDAAENRRRTQDALESLERALAQYAGEIAGIIVEPIQGAGGHRLAEREFFRELSRLAHDADVSLGFDEVQTAGGQTGKFFMVDLFDLPYPPQAVASAKKLGNGVVYMFRPMIDRGVLDSTWGGTLADMVRFVQELKIVRDERLIEQVPEKAARLVHHLRDLRQAFPRGISNVRGEGLWQGFSLASDEARDALLDAALHREHLLMLGAGERSVRLRPHLHVTMADIDLLAEKLRNLLGTL